MRNGNSAALLTIHGDKMPGFFTPPPPFLTLESLPGRAALGSENQGGARQSNTHTIPEKKETNRLDEKRIKKRKGGVHTMARNSTIILK